MTTRATLKQRSVRAFKWSMFGHGVGHIIRFASSLIMTRLLQPDMFGVMATVWMITYVLAMLSDIGLRQQVVQSHHGEDPDFLNTAWVIQIIRGGLIWLVTVVIALLAYLGDVIGIFRPDSVYASPVLPYVIAVGGSTFFIAGFQSTKVLTADRQFSQKRVVQIDLLSQVVALLVMVILGIATHSIWVLVVGSLVASFLTTTLSHTWLDGHANRFRVDSKALYELRTFGKWIFVSSAIGVLASQGDKLLLGFFVDAHTLGLYSIASMIIGVVATTAGRFSGTVSLPALSEVARTDSAKLGTTYYQLRLPVDLFLLFMMGFFYASGSQLIKILYDSRYYGAGDILKVLSLSLFALRYEVALQAYLALGKPRYFVIVNAARCIALYVLVISLYVVGGVESAIFAVAIHYWFVLPVILYLNGRVGLVDIRREVLGMVALPAGILLGLAVNYLAVLVV